MRSQLAAQFMPFFRLIALDHVVAKGLQNGKDIQGDESLINLSVILTNMAPDEAKAPESMFSHLDNYLSTIGPLIHWSIS